MRKIIILSILVSLILHVGLYTAFSNTTLFDMGAYEEKMSGLLEVKMNPVKGNLIVPKFLDKEVNLPGETKVLKKKREELVNEARIKKEILNKDQKFDKQTFERKSIAKPKMNFRDIQKSSTKDFGLGEMEKKIFESKEKGIQKFLGSDLVQPPVRKLTSKSPIASSTNANTFAVIKEQATESTFQAAKKAGDELFFTKEAIREDFGGPQHPTAFIFQEGMEADGLNLDQFQVGPGALETTGELRDQVNVQFQVFEDSKTKEQYVKIILTPKNESQYTRIPKDLLFLIDVSGSISPEVLEEVRDEILDSLGFQKEEDRFNLVLFSVNQAELYPGFQSITNESREQAEAFINRIQGSQETDIYEALMRTVPFFKEGNRILHIVFVSDARPTKGVRDYSQIINDFSQKRIGNVAFYAYDIGLYGRKLLLDYLSYENRGTYFRKNVRLRKKLLTDYLSRYNEPILYNLKVESVEGDSVEVYPRLLRHFYLGEPFSLYAYLPKEGSFRFQVTGFNAEGVQKELNVTLNTRVEVKTKDSSLSKQWGQYKIYELISAAFREGINESILEEIKKYQKKFRIKIAKEINKHLK